MGRNHCNFGTVMEPLEKLYDKFIKDKKVNKFLHDPDEAFYNLVKSEFGMELEVLQFRNDVSKGEVDGLQTRLDNLISNIEKGDIYTGLAGGMYTPSAFAKADPAIGELLNDFVHTAQYYKGTDIGVKRRMTEMFADLKLEMKERGLQSNALMTTGKALSRTSAQAKANKIESDIVETIAKIKDPKLIDKSEEVLRLQDLQNQERTIYKDSELQVYDDMLNYVENWMPKLTEQKWNDLIAAEEAKPENKRKFIKFENVILEEAEFAKIKDRDGNPISPSMYKALKKYHDIMNVMHKNLVNGVDSYIDSILLSKENTTSAEDIGLMREKLKEKLVPDKAAGYYPHYARDLNIDFISGLMPKLDELTLSSSNYVDIPTTTRQAIEQLDAYVSGHTKSRSEDLQYSPNFLNVLSTYVSEVNRFNYISHINKSKGNVLNKVESMYKNGEDSGRYIENLVDFINDLHGAAVGKNAIQNKQTAALVRTLLGFEFISKIGMNPRSAARNFSQILLNTVEWSPIMMKNSFSTIKGMKDALNVDAIMNEKGLLFSEATPELEESLGVRPAAHKVLQYNEETKGLEFVPVSKLEKVASFTSKIAGSKVVAGMTRGVENWNRKLTFRLGFGRMYSILDTPGFVEFMTDKFERTRDRKPTETEIENSRKKYATDYAINSVIGLHFDYNDFSKSAWLRHPVGKVLGQFQHYSFKFFEKNWEISRKAKNDLFRGELNGNNAWKAYRMGLAYFVAPAIAAAYTGIDFSRLIEHDAYEKLEKLGAYFFGDEEDRKKAYWGKGPIMGSIGAPVISDLLTLGHLYEFINLDEDSMLRILAGYQDYEGISGDRKTYELIRTLSTAGGRFIYKDLPQIQQGRIFQALQYDLGLYPTKKSKEKQKALHGLSPEMFKAIEALEHVGRFKK